MFMLEEEALPLEKSSGKKAEDARWWGKKGAPEARAIDGVGVCGCLGLRARQ